MIEIPSKKVQLILCKCINKLNVIFLCLFVAACSEKHLFELVPFAPKSDAKPKLEKIDFFLETSVSMKGYVNINTLGDYPLKDVVSYLLTDLDKEYPDITTLYTVSDAPRKYERPKAQFYNELRRGSLLTGKSSKLQHIFGPIIDSLQTNAVSILVSDCILDLGRDDAMSEGSSVTTKIYEHLVHQPNMAVAVFKYLSDFNGTYYYDRRNTGSSNQTQRPYYNTILKNRPFYIWVFGGKRQLRELLSQKLFEDYDKEYTYNMEMDDVPYALIQKPSRGKVSVFQEKNKVLIHEVESERPVQFTIGVNLEEQPHFYEKLFMDIENYEIEPTYLKNTIRLETKTKSELKGGEGLGFTNFLQPTLFDMGAETHKIKFSLKNPPSDWYEQTHLTDDYQVTAETLENKTFAFTFITDAFDKAYRDRPDALILTLHRKQQ